MNTIKQAQPGFELPCRREIHRVNNALIRMFQHANTWHQIVQAADAAHNVFTTYGVMEKELDRAMTENDCDQSETSDG